MQKPHTSTAKTAKSTGKQAATKTPSRTRQTQTPVSDSALEEFLVDELKDIYWAEKKLVKTLPKLQKAANSDELKQAFGNHLTETEGHVERLEQAFEMLGHKPQAKKCDAMQGITEERASAIEDTTARTPTRDV